MQYLTEQNVDNTGFIRSVLEKKDIKSTADIIRLRSGSRSRAYLIGEYVVRFPKSKEIWHIMQREKALIDMVYPYLTSDFTGKIHKTELVDGEYPFSISKRFYGKICDGRPESEFATLYQNLTPAQQDKLARRLAVFFNLMHRIDFGKLNIPKPAAPVEIWDASLKENFNFETARKALLPYKIELNEYRLKKPDMTKALCHNDLSGSNLLIDPEKEDVLIGIIDFGNATVTPKYQDFFPLYKIDRKLAVDTLEHYNRMTKSPVEMKQIDFMVLASIGSALSENSDSPYLNKMLKNFL